MDAVKLISFDPSISNTGWAFVGYDEGGNPTPLGHGIIRTSPKSGIIHRLSNIYFEISNIVNDLDITPQNTSAIIEEPPEFLRRNIHNMTLNHENIFLLNRAFACIVTTLISLEFEKVDVVLPRKWKGQTPKEETRFNINTFFFGVSNSDDFVIRNLDISDAFGINKWHYSQLRLNQCKRTE